MSVIVKKKRKRMTKKEKEANSDKIIKLAEARRLSITQATLEFARQNEIKPERIMGKITPQLIDLIKEETRKDETKYYLHRHVPNQGTLEE